MEIRTIHWHPQHSFGMLQVGRNFNSPDYKYSFNGKLKDDEISGSGNMYDYGARIYNPRIGKFLSVDPLFQTYPYYTPYQFAGNNPILNIDVDGLEELDKKYKFKGETAKPEVLSQTAVDILNMIIKKIGADKITITSTGRTPADQARIMYENLENGSSSKYGAAGRKVIALYKEMKKAGATPEEIKAAMEAKIKELGPSNVSKHAADPKKINAIDFGINSLKRDIGEDKMEELKEYLEELEEDGEIKVFLNPENNPGEAAYHIEVINKDGEGKEPPKEEIDYKSTLYNQFGWPIAQADATSTPTCPPQPSPSGVKGADTKNGGNSGTAPTP